MKDLLPRLRMELDYMPSPLPEKPGLLVRDPSNNIPGLENGEAQTLIIPPELVKCLELFDGKHSRGALREMLAGITGDSNVSTIESHILQALSNAGFLYDDNYDRIATARAIEFRNLPKRQSITSDQYSTDVDELRRILRGYVSNASAGAAPMRNDVVGIAVNHATPTLASENYGAAYRCLRPELRDRTFVILATSHYGPARQNFILTRKSYETPLGETHVDRPLVDWLANKAFKAVLMEQIASGSEHSAEFQVLFLQHLFGPDIRILPILCGSFVRALREGGYPEDDPGAAQFFDVLGELAAREGDRLFFVLSGLGSHMGVRYGDTFPAFVNQGKMLEIERLDRERIGRILANDPRGFWELCREKQDPQKWTLAYPAYTFMKAVPQARGRLEYYGQTQFDEKSVITHAALSFWRE